MTRFAHALTAAVAVVSLWQPAAAAVTHVLHFDDIVNDGIVPLNYGGLDWSSAGWTVFSVPADPYTPHSGAGRIATEFAVGDAASLIRFNQQVNFDGAWFAGLSGALLSFDLYSGATRVHSSVTLDPTATPTFLASGYSGFVDGVVVHSANHGEFVMDDFRFQVAAPVPEPETAMLVLAGLASLVGVARHRRRQQVSTSANV